MKIVISILFLTFIFVGCDSNNDGSKKLDVNSTSQTADERINEQNINFKTIGRNIQGITICLGDICKETDMSGIAIFEMGGQFDLYLGETMLRQIYTTDEYNYLSPYTIFDNNDSTAKWLERYFIATATTQSITSNVINLDQTLFLNSIDFETLIQNNVINNQLNYEVLNNRITVDADANIVMRDENIYDILMISKINYIVLERVNRFIDNTAVTDVLLNNTQLLKPNEYILEINIEDDSAIIKFENLITDEQYKAYLLDVNETHLITELDTFILSVL